MEARRQQNLDWVLNTGINISGFITFLFISVYLGFVAFLISGFIYLAYVFWLSRYSFAKPPLKADWMSDHDYRASLPDHLKCERCDTPTISQRTGLLKDVCPKCNNDNRFWRE